jgi:hypothetical protein
MTTYLLQTNYSMSCYKNKISKIQIKVVSLARLLLGSDRIDPIRFGLIWPRSDLIRIKSIKFISDLFIFESYQIRSNSNRIRSIINTLSYTLKSQFYFKRHILDGKRLNLLLLMRVKRKGHIFHALGTRYLNRPS